MSRKRFWRRFFWRVVLVVAIIFLVGVFFDVNFRVKEGGYGQEIKKIIYSIKDEVYRKATIHNPKGDVWPDWIDDFLKLEIKQVWRSLKDVLNIKDKFNNS